MYSARESSKGLINTLFYNSGERNEFDELYA